MDQPRNSYFAGLVMMVVGIVLIASIFASAYLAWGADRGIERDIGSYFLRFLAGMSLIVFGNVTRDIATRKPSEEESTPTLYTVENPFDSQSDEGAQRF